jgi:endonuclease YncB( thermonuclease family)
MKKVVFFALFCVVIASFAYLQHTGYFVVREVATVERVIDGDTIKLTDGRIVRLLGINAPETREYYHEEAKAALKSYVDGKNVSLETDLAKFDKYGRLLAHVFVDNKFVNLEMIKGGYANAYFLNPNKKYYSLFIKNEREAIEKEIGIWKREKKYSFCIQAEIEYLKNERVIIKNVCNFSIDITGWEIRNSGRSKFTFPKTILSENKSVVVYSSSGLNRNDEFYWNKSDVWKDYGDILILKDSNENLILAKRY